jgi:hypothetical protein
MCPFLSGGRGSVSSRAPELLFPRGRAPLAPPDARHSTDVAHRLRAHGSPVDTHLAFHYHSRVAIAATPYRSWIFAII